MMSAYIVETRSYFLSMSQPLDPWQAHSGDSVIVCLLLSKWMKRASAMFGYVKQTGLLIKFSCTICLYLVRLVNFWSTSVAMRFQMWLLWRIAWNRDFSSLFLVLCSFCFAFAFAFAEEESYNKRAILFFKFYFLKDIITSQTL